MCRVMYLAFCPQGGSGQAEYTAGAHQSSGEYKEELSPERILTQRVSCNLLLKCVFFEFQFGGLTCVRSQDIFRRSSSKGTSPSLWISSPSPENATHWLRSLLACPPSTLAVLRKHHHPQGCLRADLGTDLNHHGDTCPPRRFPEASLI
ncbi:hypothetical protein CHARACLAT_025576 [Characodon lateralis]|uniref:Uncharacterized protein n=1 Tax=Characodon lateralis TaxID=208331 RepID=A0ABU7CRY2_9TELE|nr:hypothetical protein [Characodon lateralis]